VEPSKTVLAQIHPVLLGPGGGDGPVRVHPDVRHDLAHALEHQLLDTREVRPQALDGGRFDAELVVDEVADRVAGPPEVPHRPAGAVAGQALDDGVVPGAVGRQGPQPAAQAEHRGAADVVANRPEEALSRPVASG
jgi:hypothetical protein